MGTGYVRNDTGNNIADGNVINASDLDGEFDAVQAAFNGSTGHSHDGTTGEGPQIDTAGIADSAVETAKINNGAVTTDKLGADAVTGAKIGDDQIDSEHYVAGSIDREHLAADIIDGTKIADDVINSEHYVAGSIDNEHLADDAVTGAKIDSTTTVTAASFVGPLTGAVTGNASTATTLQTARTIGGVSFNGSANIDLPGVNTSGNQDTSGNAATATALATSRNFDITGDITASAQSFNGTGNVTLTASIDDNVVGAAELNVTGNGTSGQALLSDGDGTMTWGNVDPFPSGTLMLFQQTAAPTGWTKQTTHNDKALRVVSGTASSGGSSAFTTAFGTPSVTGTVGISGDPAVGNLAVSVSGNISSTTLSANQIPAHSHTVRVRTGNRNFPAGSSHWSANAESYENGNNVIADNNTLITSGSAGSGSHNHGHNLSGNLNGAPSAGNLAGSLSSATAAINVQYVDLIIASKD